MPPSWVVIWPQMAPAPQPAELLEDEEEAADAQVKVPQLLGPIQVAPLVVLAYS